MKLKDAGQCLEALVKAHGGRKERQALKALVTGYAELKAALQEEFDELEDGYDPEKHALAFSLKEGIQEILKRFIPEDKDG